MAHGFLSYTPVSGDNFWKNLKDVYKGLRDLAKLYDTGNKILKANVRELDPKQLAAGTQKALPGANQKALASSPATKMLGAGAGSLATRNGGLVEKNPTNIDVKTGNRLPHGGPRLPGGPSKGGGFTDIPGIASGGLNAENFFQKAQTGVGAAGEYLTKAQRIADFRKSQEMRSAAAGAPPITGDSGADIVAAVNRNTQMIVSLVDAVKTQTKNDSRLTEQQIQTQETLMLRSAAAQKEAALEQGGDYSGFMTPENFDKKKKEEKKRETGSKLKEFFRGPNPFQKPEGCGCSPFMPGPGGRGGILGGPPGGGGGSRLGGGASVMRRGGGGKAITRAATKIGGKGLGKAVGKGLAKKIPGVGVLAGGAFAAERAMRGDWLGAGGELLSGVASLIPGLGTAVSTGIDAGLMARDAGLTPFARGGIITQPTAGLVGEAGNEGIFPLEGSRGKKTFALFGEGLLNAQMDNESDYAKLQSKGLRQYYETEGGFEKMGNIFGDIFKGLGGVLGSIGNSLLGGAANAAEGGGFGMSADEQQLTEALIAGEEGVRTKAYQDSEGIWTIGYGQTTINGRAVKQGDQISKEEALTGFRSNVKSHAQRAINQVGEKRWQQLDPKARAVLTSLAYNYGSIPDAVLPAAKSGSTEDIAKSMNKLYGHNNGDLKGRRQREQSILRGNLQGDAGNAVRLDKDFVAGGKFAGAGTGPIMAGGPGASPPPGYGGKVIEYITGDKSSKNYRSDHGGGNYHDHIAFDSKPTRDAAAAWLKQRGWKIGSMNDGRHADGSYHYSDKAFDIPFYPNQRIKGVTDDGKGETKLSTMLRTDLARGGFSGSGIAALPGAGPPTSPSSPVASNTRSGQGGTAGANRRRSTTTSPGSLQASAATPPGPVPASPAAANNGTPLMASSQQVAMGTMGLTTQGA